MFGRPVYLYRLNSNTVMYIICVLFKTQEMIIIIIFLFIYFIFFA